LRALAFVLIAAAVLGADSPARSAAHTYFVDSERGDDENAGTSTAAAWRTLARVNDASLRPGDRVLLRRGASWPGTLRIDGSGSERAPIVVTAYGRGRLPVVRGGRTCIDLRGSYLVVRNVHADACAWAGIAVWGSHNRVERSLISRNAAGVHVRDSAVGTRIIRNRLVDNDKMSVLTPRPADDDSGAFGVLLEGDGGEVAYNTISGCDAFSYDYGRDGAAIEVYGGRRNSIHHNLALNNDAFTELGNPRSERNTYAVNVVRSSLARSTFLVTRGARSRLGPVLRTSAFHNTVVLTGATSQGVVCHAGCSPNILTLRNNIVQAVWKVGFADGSFDEGNNLFSGGALEFTPRTSSKVGDPLFRNLGRGNLRLRAASPAIDAGAAVGIPRDFDGRRIPADGDGDGVARPDLGAFEFRR
jgi:hypothetical protein